MNEGILAFIGETLILSWEDARWGARSDGDFSGPMEDSQSGRSSESWVKGIILTGRSLLIESKNGSSTGYDLPNLRLVRLVGVHTVELAWVISQGVPLWVKASMLIVANGFLGCEWPIP